MPRLVPARPHARSLFVGVGLALAVVVFLGVSTLTGYVSATRAVEHSLEIRQQSRDWLAAATDAETGARGYVLTPRASLLELYTSAMARERVAALALQQLLLGDATQTKNVLAADQDAHLVMANLRNLVELATAGRQSEALARLESDDTKQRMEVLRNDLRGIRALEEGALLSQRTAVRSRTLFALVGGGALALSACALVVLAWRREKTHDEIVTNLATEARERLKTLSVVAAALSKARTRTEVATVIVEETTRAVSADICTLYELDDTGEVLELIGDRGVAPDVLDQIRSITARSGNPAALAALKSLTSTWAESEADYAKLYPRLAAVKAEGPRAKAFWAVPLVVEGRPVGLLGAGFYGPRTFSEDVRSFVETLAHHCAQALARTLEAEREDEAQQWFRTTLRSIGDALIATDGEGLVMFMNQVAVALTGWTEDEAKGRPLEEVFSLLEEETRTAIGSPVKKVLRDGSSVAVRNRTLLQSKSGARIPIEDRGAPIRNENGDIVGVVLVFRDATAEKRARAQSEFLARAGEVLVASLDYEATLATVARFAVPTLADWCAVDLVQPGDAIPRQVAVAHVEEAKVRFAREFRDRYPPDPSSPTGVLRVIQTGKAELYPTIPAGVLDAVARDADHLRLIRELRIHSVLIVPLRVRDRVLGAITFIHAESRRQYTSDDLTFGEDFARRASMAIENSIAMKEAETARTVEHALRAEAELASRAKDEFLATVSHELRTPLNAILGWTVTLRRRKPQEDMDRALGVIERNARLQAKLIEDVLDVARVISGKLALNLRATHVADIVKAAMETVTPAAEAKNILTSLDVAEDLPTITADADRLQQIVWNLLSNAVKFTPKGGRVMLRARRDGGDVSISVADTGEGIRADVLPIVFERFQQADATTTRRHGGLGLGLAIVRQLVTAHGGTVRAESEGEGKGATFTAILPARAPAGDTGSLFAASLPVDASTGPLAPRLDGLRVLVVDDEDDARGLAIEVLRGEGAEVHAAGSAADALKTFAAVRPDVVVSDIGMPDVDGFSLMMQIRALPAEDGGRTPAVALTAYARPEDADRALAAGFQIHMTKPLEPPRLATAVANLAGRFLEVD